MPNPWFKIENNPQEFAGRATRLTSAEILLKPMVIIIPQNLPETGAACSLTERRL
jgi:hypothetical protein